MEVSYSETSKNFLKFNYVFFRSTTIITLEFSFSDSVCLCCVEALRGSLRGYGYYSYELVLPVPGVAPGSETIKLSARSLTSIRASNHATDT